MLDCSLEWATSYVEKSMYLSCSIISPLYRGLGFKTKHLWVVYSSIAAGLECQRGTGTCVHKYFVYLVF